MKFRRFSPATIVLSVLIFVGLAVGVYLVRQRQIFTPKATSQEPNGLTGENFTQIADRWGSMAGSAKYSEDYDLNKDGLIGSADLRLAKLVDLADPNRVSPPGSIVQGSVGHSGYIIEFRSDPLVKNIEKLRQDKESTKNDKVLGLQDQIIGEEKNLINEHEKAKGQISRSLDKMLVIPSAGRGGREAQVGETVEILGEYTAVINGIALKINDDEAQKVKSLPEIKAVYPNRFVRALGTGDGVWNLAKIKADGLWQARDKNGEQVTGKGVNIAIIDTGVDYTHSDLGNCSRDQVTGGSCSKVISGHNFVTCERFNFATGECLEQTQESDDPIDLHFHGTHVAATAAGNGVVKGVAPDARIVAYRVLNKQGAGSDSWIISALEKSVQTRLDKDPNNDVDVVNLSLGADGGLPDDLESLAVDNAVDAGIVVVAAAGNEGPGEATIHTPGVARKVVTVGAISRDNSLPDFTSRGPVLQRPGQDYELLKPNVVAPGVDICAARSVNGSYPSLCIDNNHILLEGTSMATPHIAGSVALLLQLHPDWNPEDIKSALVTTAFPQGRSALVEGNGLVDLSTSTYNVTRSIFSPVSLSFGLVDKTEKSWKVVKNLVIKNVSGQVQNYSSLVFKTTPGVAISLSEKEFSIDPAKSDKKTIQVTLEVDTQFLANGIYTDEIQIADDIFTYRIQILYFKKDIEMTFFKDDKFTQPVEPSSSNSHFYAQIVTPYSALRNPPVLTIESGSGKSNPPLFSKENDLTTWRSGAIDLVQGGEYQVEAASSELPSYRTVSKIVVDQTPPVFTVKVAKKDKVADLQVSSNEPINQGYTHQFVDKEDTNGYTYLHSMPDVFTESKNMYLAYVDQVFSRFKDSETGKTRVKYSRYIQFSQSGDLGKNWSTPMSPTGLVDEYIDPTLEDFNNMQTMNVKISKLGSKIYIFYNQITDLKYVSGDGDKWTSPQIVEQGVKGGGVDANFSVKVKGNNLYIVYLQFPSLSYKRFNGSNWEDPTKITDKYGFYGNFYLTPIGFGFDYSTDEMRIVIPADPTTTSLTRSLVYLKSKDGKSWQEKNIILEKGTRFYDANPKILSSGDNVYVVTNRNESMVDFAKSVDGGLSWIIKKDITSVSSQGNISGIPKLTLAGNRLYLLWTLGIYESTVLNISDDFGETWGGNIFIDPGSGWGTSMDQNIVSSGSLVSILWSQGWFPARIALSQNKDVTSTVVYNKQEEPVALTKSGENVWSGQFSYKGNGTYTISVSGEDLAGNLGKASANYEWSNAWACTPCVADTDKNGVVDLTDFNRLKLCFGKKSFQNDSLGRSCVPADITGDSNVNIGDYSCFIAQFKKTCAENRK